MAGTLWSLMSNIYFVSFQGNSYDVSGLGIDEGGETWFKAETETYTFPGRTEKAKNSGEERIR